MSGGRVNVSISKFYDFLIKKGFLIVCVYTEQDSIRFIELKMPKTQKNIIVYISKKYKMQPNTSKHKNLSISILNNKKQFKYLADIKGLGTENLTLMPIHHDLISISSRHICLHKDNGNIEIYALGENIQEKTDIVMETQTSKVIKEAESILNKLKIHDSNAKKYESEKYLNNTNDEEEEIENEEVEEIEDEEIENEDVEDEAKEPIELIFEDKEGDLVDNIQDFLGDDSEQIDFDEYSIDGDDIVLGIIYYCVDLAYFYKNILTLEEDAVDIYNIIDENENKMREDKIDQIEETMEQILTKIKSLYKTYEKDETELKIQLNKLSEMFDKTLLIKNKVEYIESKYELEKTHNQIKSTIKETNLDLLRKKDKIDDTLDNTYTTLKELVDIIIDEF